MTATICPGCGKPTATERKYPTNYNYVECGLPNVWLSGGVIETNCANCGRKYVRVKREGQLLQVIALDLLTCKRRLSGAELRFLRGACGLSQAALAALLETRRETVAEREAKQDPKLSKMEILGVRLTLLKSFLEFLEEDGNNLLAESHMAKLRSFTLDYCTHVLKTVDKEVREFHTSRTSEDWQPMAA